MSTEFYTEPRLTMEELKRLMPEGYLLRDPRGGPRYLKYSSQYVPYDPANSVEQYVIECPDGSALWVFLETRPPELSERYAPGTVRFEAFANNRAVPFLRALEQSASVKAFDEYGLDMDDTPG